jgi:hypothetical protein
VAVPSMMQRQSWVVNEHSRSRVTHDLFNFFFHVWSVAVNYTFATCAFFVLKWTFVKAQKSVFFELFAFGAELFAGFVVIFAVNVNHVAFCFLFTLHSFVFWVRRLRLHFNSILEIGLSNSLKGLP